ncbi:uncharacterized protein EV422DRAFT_516375 [Fimicolochytrium jonesii]|uniref:uncharacterized protein n=1 Tax=Fimicolochytrium jonesii TaxID=1396493 RepID=UPI0022FF0422|nr:uncharacterized protein EV422DRAFT_516375 [Fimicolochytrium jonesii]KAI8824845.1 hypothetical protein EV422DRAFT_516375 [Fimicolochytrium jonesii]
MRHLYPTPRKVKSSTARQHRHYHRRRQSTPTVSMATVQHIRPTTAQPWLDFLYPVLCTATRHSRVVEKGRRGGKSLDVSTTAMVASSSSSAMSRHHLQFQIIKPRPLRQHIRSHHTQTHHQSSLATHNPLSILATFTPPSLPPFPILPLVQPPKKPQHYLFGYGSLINPHSRLRTVRTPTHAIPAVVRGLHRSWSYKCARKSYTAVGVRRIPDSPTARCNGVLIPLSDPDTELRMLDEREKDYVRGTLRVEDIEILHFNTPPSPPTISHPFGTTSTSPAAPVVVWVYELPPPSSRTSACMRPAAPHTPTPCTPIPQSYIDCILTGCLAIHPTFARLFIDHTAGWDSGPWINDRAACERSVKRYVGAEAERGAEEVDGLLREGVPESFSARVEV